MLNDTPKDTCLEIALRISIQNCWASYASIYSGLLGRTLMVGQRKRDEVASFFPYRFYLLSISACPPVIARCTGNGDAKAAFLELSTSLTLDEWPYQYTSLFLSLSSLSLSYIYIYIYIYYSTKKREHFLTYWKAFFFVRHSSEYETSDNDRKVIHIARCGYTWLDESKWPQEWPISPITIIIWRFQEKRWNLSVYTRLGFESWYKQIPKHLNEKTICLAQWSSFHLSVLESVYIKTQNPVLCKQKDFIFSLGIFK